MKSASSLVSVCATSSQKEGLFPGGAPQTGGAERADETGAESKPDPKRASKNRSSKNHGGGCLIGGGSSKRGARAPSVTFDTKGLKGDQEQFPPHNLKSPLFQRFKEKCGALNDSPRFCILTTVLTIYALFGDDFRLATTDQATDNLFNCVTLFSIVVFSLEMVAASVARDGYFLGFFFVLDLGATVTLVLDLTWVWDALACNSLSEGGSGALKSSRAGRAGARAARSVRIIRLIRLVKIYKAYKVAAEAKDRLKQKNEHKVQPGENEEEEEDDLLGEEDEQEADGDEATHKKIKESATRESETRVGKKLSDMTTRRVIILVLVMLFIMPLFTTSAYGFDEYRVSGDMGAEFVYHQLRSWCQQPGNDSGLPWCLESPVERKTSEDGFADRYWYEQYLLTYIYSHFDGTSAWKLYWVGFKSVALALTGKAADVLPPLARLNQIDYLGSSYSKPNILDMWDGQFTDSRWQASVHKLPKNVQEHLIRPWREHCSGYFGVCVSPDLGDVDRGCSIDLDLRCSEVQSYVPATTTRAELDDLSMMFVFDTRGTTRLAAGLSILQTVFICFAVGLGAMSFSSDANHLLLKPIERMMAKMETIKKDPLFAMRLGDMEFRQEEIERAKREEKFARRGRCWKFLYLTYDKQKFKEPMETIILEKTIIKLGGLLALGFGEAGAEIIGHNMRTGHSSGVNAMIPGQKVDAIIGFCKIRHFTEATEVLKEKVMIFVNQIGEIVHGCVDDYMGAPNRNIGDCFLLIWRLSGADPQKQSKLADMALMSAAKIISETHRSRILARYREHPGLLQRIKDYRVLLAFGLHCGWAIEGAIGSEFKIDASYLSPNVNVASRLEAAAAQFDVWVLLSHFMIDLCGTQMGGECRLIDHVRVKGSKQTIRLYTLDLDFLSLPIRPPPIGLRSINRYKMRQVREVFKAEKWSEEYRVWNAFTDDPDINEMRLKYTPEFFGRWAMAFRNYIAGQWRVAREMLLTCHYDAEDDPSNAWANCDTESESFVFPDDGPAKVLLNYMQDFGNVAPSDWVGHRQLMRK